jgi:dolichyl-phosphate beta-glucosyltransferase
MVQQPDLSIIIPAYNEEERLQKTLEDLDSFLCQQSLSYEIIVVSDGSQDNTGVLVQSWQKAHANTLLIQNQYNSGKGYAVKQGALEAQGRYILMYDADGATPIAEVERLWQVLQKKPYAIAIGSRALACGQTKVETKLYRKLIGRVFNTLLFALTPGIQDTQCGFKLFPSNIAHAIFNRQTLKGFAFDVELLHIALENQIEICEVPVNWQNQPGSKVNLLWDSGMMFLSLVKIAWQSCLGYYQLKQLKTSGRYQPTFSRMSAS